MNKLHLSNVKFKPLNAEYIVELLYLLMIFKETIKQLQLLPMNIQNEKDFCPVTLDYLKKIGHNIITFSGIGSAITAISKENGFITANSDYRRQGTTAGL